MSSGTGLKKRSIRIGGHDTSITLEDSFWSALKEIAAEKDTSLSALITEIDTNNTGNLSSTIRVYILSYYKNL